MTQSANEGELLDLAWAMANDRLDDAGAARLEQLVVGDPTMRRTYLYIIDLVAGLEWGEVERSGQGTCKSNAGYLASEGVEDPHALAEAEIAARTFGVELSTRRTIASTTPRALPAWMARSSSRAILAVACVYYVVAAGLFYSLSIFPDTIRGGSVVALPSEAVIEPSQTHPIPPSTKPHFLARLMGGRNIRWANADVPTAIGADLPLGVLELTHGVAEVSFGRGALVALKAPVRLTLISADGLRLDRGRLSAVVPPGAVGFSVETPTSKVIDLGTEFGVDVFGDGSTHVRVLKGKVALADVNQPSSTPAKQAILFAGESRFMASTVMPAAQGEPNQTATIEDEASIRLRDHFVRKASKQAGPVLVEQGGSFAPNNLALGDNAKAFATACLLFAPHKTESLNDGRYGNHSSWIAAPGERFIAGINLGGNYTIGSIAFGRDNGNEHPEERPEVYTDRCAGMYTLQVTTVENPDETTPDSDWKMIGEISQGGEELDIATGRFKPYLRHRYEFRAVEATGVRLVISDPEVAIDELEVYEAASK